VSNNYLKKLLHYITSVYNIKEKINRLNDERLNKRISTSAIAFVVLFGFMLKVRSFNRLDNWLEYDDFRPILPKKLRLPRIDAVRDSLKVFDIKTLDNMHNGILRDTKNNKLYRNGTIDGYKVAAFDGVELFESTNKNCSKCLTREINGVTHYFHRAVVASYVGADPRIVIGAEMLTPKKDSSNKDEGELTGAKRLLKNLHKKHHHFADVIVYDALACNSPWINAAKSCGIDAVVRVKNERLDIVKDAMGLFKGSKPDKVWEFKKSSRKHISIAAWDDNILMNGVEGSIRFVQYIETITDVNTGKNETNKIWLITTAKHIAVGTLWKMIHARWDVENNIFHQLKTEWHMDHCFIHHKNGLEAALKFQIVAFNLMQLYFFRRLKDFRQRRLLQVEVIERIIKEMVVYDAQGKYLLDTS
jgi:hypothetical protein